MKRPLHFASAVLLMLQVATSARAQFVVEATSPPDGSVNVPLQDTIAFAFTQEVDISTDWNTAFIFEPRDSLQFSRVALCLTMTGQCDGGSDIPRFVRFSVSQRPNTDYTWFVYAVESLSGNTMAEPLVLRYTTAPTRGAFQITGSVDAVAAKNTTAALALPQRRTLSSVVRLLEENGYGVPTYHSASSPLSNEEADPAVSISSVPTDPHTLVLLLDDFTTQERIWSVRAGTVIQGTSGSYVIDYVRPGSYWPIAVRYTDGSLEQIEAIGLYDPDGDGTPDEVIVDAESRADINLTTYGFPLSTARAHLDVAADAASAFADDQQLVLISAGNGIRPSGEAYTWTYSYFSPSQNTETSVNVEPLDLTTSSEPSSGLFENMTPLDPATLLDSDAALGMVADNGGEDFWNNVPLRLLNTTLQAGNLFWRPEVADDETVWYVQVRKLTQSPFPTLEQVVDAVDGSLVATEDAGPLSNRTALLANHPNPVRTETTLAFILAEPINVYLRVYNLLGQRVATLLDGRMLPGGSHEVTWSAAGVPSGVYLYRLEAGSRSESRRLLVLK